MQVDCKITCSMRNVKKEEKEDANKRNKKHHQGGMKKEKEINKDELHKK